MGRMEPGHVGCKAVEGARLGRRGGFGGPWVGEVGEEEDRLLGSEQGGWIAWFAEEEEEEEMTTIQR